MTERFLASSAVQTQNISSTFSSGPGSTNATLQSSPSTRTIEWRKVNLCLCFLALLLLLAIAYIIVVSLNPLYTLIFVIIAIAPAFVIHQIIRRYFWDDAVPPYFLVTQFLLAAIPLIIIVFLLETIISALLVFTILPSEINSLFAKAPDEQFSIDDLKTLVPTWKLVLLSLLSAYVVAAFVEETAKWVLTRRYRQIDELQANQERNLNIGVRGILAVAGMSALGFATIENLLYVLGWSMSPTKTKAFPFSQMGLAVLRDIFAFPLHIGTTFVIALVEARRKVFSDGVSLGTGFAIAIFFHGSFDAISLVIASLVLKDVAPSQFEYISVALQALLVVLLIVLCRGRFHALVQRERALVEHQFPDV